MKKITTVLLSMAVSSSMMAEYVMYVNQGDLKVREEKCEDIVEIKGKENTVSIFKNSKSYDYDINNLNLTFEKVQNASDTVVITYGDEAQVVNPFPETVLVTKSGNFVSVKCVNQLKDVVYLLKGTSDNGYFMIESPRKFKVVMDNLSLKSQDAMAPIRSFSSSTMTVVLPDDTKSFLEDSAIDTCNATMRSKGQIIFDAFGNGSLEVKANVKRAIQSGDYLQIDGGNILASSLYGDAVRVNDYLEMNGGTLIVEGTGIDVTGGYALINGGKITCSSSFDDSKLIKVGRDTTKEASLVNGAVRVNGGEIELNVLGNAGKGIKADYDIVISGGTIKGTVSGANYDDGIDNSYACLLKSDRNVLLQGGEVEVNLTEKSLGGRAIGADSGIVVTNGAVLKVMANNNPYVTAKGKFKYGYGLKTVGDITFSNCKVEIVSNVDLNGPIAVYSELGIVNVEKDAYLYARANNNCVKSKYVVLNGGVLIAVSGTKSIDKITSNGGVYVGISNSYPAANMYQGTYGSLLDSQFPWDGTFAISDANSNLKVAFTGETAFSNSNETAYLQVCLPMNAGETFNYTFGGTIATGNSFHGFYENATYTGGTAYPIVAPLAARSVTVTK